MAYLDELNFKEEYRSDKGNLINDFYIPCLTHSVEYFRAVGYFSSEIYLSALTGLNEFLDRGGSLKLVASPKLTEADFKAIQSGLKTIHQVAEQSLVEALESETMQELGGPSQLILAWLIKTNKLQVKIAIPRGNMRGIYHEKLGIFRDEKGNFVAFSGSANETQNAMMENFEQIDVFPSCRPEDFRRASNKLNNFNEIWSQQTNSLDVLDMPEAVKRKLIETYKPTQSSFNEAVNICQQALGSIQLSKKYKLPGNISLFDYQKRAIDNWFNADFQGVFEMATGSGKTFTAIQAMLDVYSKLAKAKKSLVCIITCPYVHLAEGWANQISDIGPNVIRCYGQSKVWKKEVERLSLISYSEISKLEVLVVVNTTFGGSSFQSLINQLANVPVLFIADEMHNLGAPHLAKCLPEGFKLRLGLSATPERHMDEEGTQALADYFKNPVIKYTLQDALNEGRLTPYEYHPVLVTLNHDEFDEYISLSKRISKLSAMKEEGKSQPDVLKSLLIKRARLLANVEDKFVQLEKLINERETLSNSLVYVGDGRCEEDDSEQRYITKVQAMIGRTRSSEGSNFRVSQFTCEESKDERMQLIQDYEKGDLDCLVAIRCLDEGVDIPCIETAYILASSTNPRQQIQRRGRILRRFPGKKLAHIYDFIVVPDLGKVNGFDKELYKLERKMLSKELERVSEFAGLARNSLASQSVLREVKIKYQLLGG